MESFFIIIRGQIGGHGPSVIKKARMTWAGGGDAEGRLVIVHEGCDTYVA